MVKYLFIFSVLLCSIQAVCQSDSEIHISKQSEYNTYNQTILVRLKTRKPSIDALKKMGREEQAKKIEDK